MGVSLKVCHISFQVGLKQVNLQTSFPLSRGDNQFHNSTVSEVINDQLSKFYPSLYVLEGHFTEADFDQFISNVTFNKFLSDNR